MAATILLFWLFLFSFAWHAGGHVWYHVHRWPRHTGRVIIRLFKPAPKPTAGDLMLPLITIPLTREEFEKRRAELAANGLVLNGDSGEIRSHGAHLTYDYNGTDLTIDIVSALPFTGDKIEKRIREWFAA